MAPSAPLPLPSPAALTAFLEGDGTVHPCNGSDSPPDGTPPALAVTQQQPRFPGKSNLKRHSMFSSPPKHCMLPPRHARSLSGGQNEYGLIVSNTFDKAAQPAAAAAEKQEPPPKVAVADAGNGMNVDDDCKQYIPKDSRVTWTDNHGKDLAEVWEYEPSDSNDSDEESDSDSAQTCTCVIQ